MRRGHWYASLVLFKLTPLGCLKVTYGEVLLYDNEGKKIGNTTLLRSDYDEESARTGQQRVVLKKKEVFLADGFHINLGNKVVQEILSTQTIPSNSSPRSKVQLPNLISKLATSFYKTLKNANKKKPKRSPQNPRKKIQLHSSHYQIRIRLAAANRNTGGFKTPFKGATSNAKKNVKPLHSPYVANSLIVFEPKGVGEKYFIIFPPNSHQLAKSQLSSIQF